MKRKIFLRTLCCLFVAIMACGTAMAQGRQGLIRAPGRATGPMAGPTDAPLAAPFGGNLEVNACTGCNFDEVDGGYYVWGTNNCIQPGTTQWIGVPFISKRTGTTRFVMAGIELDPACSTSTNQVTLSIYTDDCTTGPGTVIASGNATVSPGPCITARARVAAALTAGTRYWAVATTTSPAQDGLDSVWYGSNQSQIGGNVANGGRFFFQGFVPSFQVN